MRIERATMPIDRRMREEGGKNMDDSEDATDGGASYNMVDNNVGR